jgi:hypothetical protein
MNNKIFIHFFPVRQIKHKIYYMVMRGTFIQCNSSLSLQQILFCLSLSCVLCTQCCQFLWIVHSWLPLRFSLTLVYLFLTRHMTKTNKTKSAVGLVNTSCQFGEVKHGLASALVVRCAEYFDDTKIPTCT